MWQGLPILGDIVNAFSRERTNRANERIARQSPRWAYDAALEYGPRLGDMGRSEFRQDAGVQRAERRADRRVDRGDRLLDYMHVDRYLEDHRGLKSIERAGIRDVGLRRHERAMSSILGDRAEDIAGRTSGSTLDAAMSRGATLQEALGVPNPGGGAGASGGASVVGNGPQQAQMRQERIEQQRMQAAGQARHEAFQFDLAKTKMQIDSNERIAGLQFGEGAPADRDAETNRARLAFDDKRFRFEVQKWRETLQPKAQAEIERVVAQTILSRLDAETRAEVNRAELTRKQTVDLFATSINAYREKNVELAAAAVIMAISRGVAAVAAWRMMSQQWNGRFAMQVERTLTERGFRIDPKGARTDFGKDTETITRSVPNGPGAMDWMRR